MHSRESRILAGLIIFKQRSGLSNASAIASLKSWTFSRSDRRTQPSPCVRENWDATQYLSSSISRS
jgi:hypothetical protein